MVKISTIKDQHSMKITVVSDCSTIGEGLKSGGKWDKFATEFDRMDEGNTMHAKKVHTYMFRYKKILPKFF